MGVFQQRKNVKEVNLNFDCLQYFYDLNHAEVFGTVVRSIKSLARS